MLEKAVKIFIAFELSKIFQKKFRNVQHLPGNVSESPTLRLPEKCKCYPCESTSHVVDSVLLNDDNSEKR